MKGQHGHERYWLWCGEVNVFFFTFKHRLVLPPFHQTSFLVLFKISCNLYRKLLQDYIESYKTQLLEMTWGEVQRIMEQGDNGRYEMGVVKHGFCSSFYPPHSVRPFLFQTCKIELSSFVSFSLFFSFFFFFEKKKTNSLAPRRFSSQLPTLGASKEVFTQRYFILLFLNTLGPPQEVFNPKVLLRCLMDVFTRVSFFCHFLSFFCVFSLGTWWGGSLDLLYHHHYLVDVINEFPH